VPEGHIVKFSLNWGLQHQYFSNYFILNSYQSLHNVLQIPTAGCIFYSIIRNLKGGFSTLIHI